MENLDRSIRASTPKRAKFDDSVAGDDSEVLFIDSEDETMNVSTDSRFISDSELSMGANSILFLDSTDGMNNTIVLSDDECTSKLCSKKECCSNICLADSHFNHDHEVSVGSESIIFLDSTDCTNDSVSEGVSDAECVSKPCSKKVAECCNNKCLESFSVKEFKSATQHFQSKSNLEQRQYLLDNIILTSPSGV